MVVAGQRSDLSNSSGPDGTLHSVCSRPAWGRPHGPCGLRLGNQARQGPHAVDLSSARNCAGSAGAARSLGIGAGSPASGWTRADRVHRLDGHPADRSIRRRSLRTVPYGRQRQPGGAAGSHADRGVAAHRQCRGDHSHGWRHADDVSRRAANRHQPAGIGRARGPRVGYRHEVDALQPDCRTADCVYRTDSDRRCRDRRGRLGLDRGDPDDLCNRADLGSTTVGSASFLFHRACFSELDPPDFRSAGVRVSILRLQRADRRDAERVPAPVGINPSVGQQGLCAAGERRLGTHHAGPGVGQRLGLVQGLGSSLLRARETDSVLAREAPGRPSDQPHRVPQVAGTGSAATH